MEEGGGEGDARVSPSSQSSPSGGEEVFGVLLLIYRDRGYAGSLKKQRFQARRR